MSGRAAIEALVPHAGTMCLWDEVVSWDEDRIVLRADNHRDPAHPLRSGGRLRALHLCEYGDDLPGPLEGMAEQLAHSPDSQQYAFRISHAGTLLAEGRAAVMLGATTPR